MQLSLFVRGDETQQRVVMVDMGWMMKLPERFKVAQKNKQQYREVMKYFPRDAAPSKVFQTEYTVNSLVKVDNDILSFSFRPPVPVQSVASTKASCYFIAFVNTEEALGLNEIAADYEEVQRPVCTDRDRGLLRANRAVVLRRGRKGPTTCCIVHRIGGHREKVCRTLQATFDFIVNFVLSLLFGNMMPLFR